MKDEFTRQCHQLLPRMLTQVCRDPCSQCYGCFDRNWWHYKVRDFPSIILQQGGYTLYLADQLNNTQYAKEDLAELVAAVGSFWQKRALKYHCFEEYYPWENAYPPLAFSSLAIVKLIYEGAIDERLLYKGVEKASTQLLTRFEYQASNQQVAGLAALAFIKEVYPELCTQRQFDRISNKTLVLQNEEGWFYEYGGPDLGYLSVTLDCLWDLFDLTQDQYFLESAKKAMDFVHSCVEAVGHGLAMCQSRNTDYILPYGIVRFFDNQYGMAEKANNVFQSLYGELGSSQHFFHAIDDRYLCHYVGHSFVRATLFLSKVEIDHGFGREQKVSDRQEFFDQAGLLFKKTKTYASVVSLKKGGVFYVHQKDNYIADFGWIIKKKRSQWVTHWWSDKNSWKLEKETVQIQGEFIKTKEILSSPLKHLLLRFMSIAFGFKMIKLLKKKFIFLQSGSRRKESRHIFYRDIKFCDGNVVIVSDIIGPLPEKMNVIRAPRSSKRHVASADSYHCEDLSLAALKPQESRTMKKKMLYIESVYQLEAE